ncbi:MAG: alcohol dehydrogenase-like regulatory protein ErcA [Desulfovibrionaceae bacterium]
MTDQLLELRKFVAPEFVYGAGAMDLAGRYAQNLGMRRVLVVTDPGVAEAGWADHVLASLADAGLETACFDQVSPNPRDTEVMLGAERFRERGCDGIVAVGGGSPMDLAKGVGIVCSNGRHILTFEGADNVPRPAPPLVCIPTTAGSSADVSQFAIISDTGRKVKIAIVSKTVVPDAALIDPAATLTMPPGLTADTGLDALTHAVEALVSNANSPVTDLFALEAVRRIARALPAVMDRPDDLPARSEQMLGSLYAGMAFSNAILGAVHAMAHSLGGLMDLPHGLCNAILLDAVVAANFPAAPERYRRFGRALGADIPDAMPDDEARDAVLAALRELKRRVGVTGTLGRLGVRPEDIARLAQHALADPCMATNPLSLDQHDVERLFQAAL